MFNGSSLIRLTSSPSYLAADASFDAAKVIARKNDILSLRTAASLARISGEASLAQSLSMRCAKDLAAARDWVGAQEVLSLQDSLLVSSPSVNLGLEDELNVCEVITEIKPVPTFCRSTGCISVWLSCSLRCWETLKLALQHPASPVTRGRHRVSVTLVSWIE